MIKIKNNSFAKTILFLSLPQALLIVIASSFGIFYESTYSKETASYAAQGIGQDIINLFIVAPMLIVSALLIFRKNITMLFVWSGAIVYIIYSYVIYSFGIHFNFLFLVYCAILGLSVYSFMYYTGTLISEPLQQWYDDRVPVKTVSIFFLVIAVLFYIIWLGDILPALLAGRAPKSVIESGIMVNPVHVLDLSLALPGLIITAIFLLKRKTLGFLLAPAFLGFCLFMAVAIGGMVVVMRMKGMNADMGLAVLFGVLAIISLALLVVFLRCLKNEKI